MGGILLLSLLLGLIIYTAWVFYPYINAKLQLYLLKYSSIPTLEEVLENVEVEQQENPPNKVLLIFQKYFEFYTKKLYDFI
jgi:hypothetical protein